MQQQAATFKWLMRFFSLLFIPTGAYVPAGVATLWVSNSLFGVAQVRAVSGHACVADAVASCYCSCHLHFAGLVLAKLTATPPFLVTNDVPCCLPVSLCRRASCSGATPSGGGWGCQPWPRCGTLAIGWPQCLGLRTHGQVQLQRHRHHHRAPHLASCKAHFRS